MILHHSRSWQTLESWTTIVWNIIQIQHGSEELWPGHIFGMCALWPWPWRYDLGSRSWHILGSWTKSVWNIIQIQLCFDELWPGHGFSVNAHFDLDLGHMTLCQGNDTPLGHRQQLCEILSRFRSCWKIVSKLNLAPVNFHNRKCLAMKLILYTYEFK